MKQAKEHLAEGVFVYDRPLESRALRKTADYSICNASIRFDVLYNQLKPFYLSLSDETQGSLRNYWVEMESMRKGVLHSGASLSGHGDMMVTMESIIRRTQPPRAPLGQSQKAGSGGFMDFINSDGSNASILELVKKYGFLTGNISQEPIFFWQCTILEFKLAAGYLKEEQYDRLSTLLSNKVKTTFFCAPKNLPQRQPLTEEEKERRQDDLEDQQLKNAPLNYFLLLPDFLSNLWYSFIKTITAESRVHMCLNPGCEGEKWFLVESWDARCRTDFCQTCTPRMTARIYRAGKKWAELDRNDREAVVSVAGAPDPLVEVEWKKINKAIQVKMLPQLLGGKGRPRKV